jgi:hypothetical protein
MERDWERLSAAVLKRRTAEGWTQQDVWDRGGPSDTLQSEIEQNRWRPTRTVKQTLDKIDAGLKWQAGSAQRVLTGGDPLPIPESSPPRGDVPPEPPQEPGQVDAQQVIEVVGHLYGLSTAALKRKDFEVMRISSEAAASLSGVIADRNTHEEETNRAMETATQSDASAEAVENEEGGQLEQPQRRPALGRPRGLAHRGEGAPEDHTGQANEGR